MSSTASDSIAGRVAVVVGAAGGIGRAITARLARAGCHLALVDVVGDALDEVARGVGLEGSGLACCADITDWEQVERTASDVQERFGQVHILVNTAGINTKQRTLADLSPEQWERVVAVNLNGAFHCVRAFLPIMKESGGGIVVNIVSAAAWLVSAGAGTHYCAAKRALLSLTESINIEQGRHGIRACAICPGEVVTPLVNHRPEPPSAERLAAMLRPEDVAEAVHYVVTRPSRVTVSELTIFPSSQISGRFVV
ncbi:MAG: SDR family oxidoreductase [Candidatus Brocadiae bacterium]|nr:SDR family oxidoreductase [Candidatus Brocadiia bacterium]